MEDKQKKTGKYCRATDIMLLYFIDSLGVWKQIFIIYRKYVILITCQVVKYETQVDV